MRRRRQANADRSVSLYVNLDIDSLQNRFESRILRSWDSGEREKLASPPSPACHSTNTTHFAVFDREGDLL